MCDLKKHLTNYLTLRRSLGYKLEESEKLLNDFINFIEEKGSSIITVELALEWALLPKNVQPSYWSRRLCIVRLFSQYLINYIPEIEVPDSKLLCVKTKRATPYFYSDEQIKQVLNACYNEQSKGLRHLTFYTLFGLLAVTGCRISELVNLSINDVNLKTGIITILDSKFGKSRHIPISSSTNDKLDVYSNHRTIFIKHPSSDNFFLSEQGKPLTVNCVEIFYVRLSKKINLRHKDDSYGPRIHDFRHTFAIKSLINSYKASADVNQIIPLLATYLGHKKPSDTYWYLTNVPELMALAADKLEQSGVLL
jgi:integrase/recombinase XerD